MNDIECPFYILERKDKELSQSNYNKYQSPLYPIDESWKAIDDSIIEGVKPGYFISTYGRVFSSNINSLMISNIDKYGYLKITIPLLNGNKRYITIHRLVALAFIHNNDDSKVLVNHKDDIRFNPHINNLEWCDYSYNITYTYIRKNMTNKYRLFSNEQVHKICTLLQDDIIIRNISKIIYPDKIDDEKFMKNIDQAIRRIERKDGYLELSKDYDFSNRENNNGQYKKTNL